MKLTAFDRPDLFTELQPVWNELLQRSIANCIFSTWEWQSTWWEAYQHRGKLWVITCRTDDGRLAGIAPWFVEDHPVHGRVVRSIGCVDVTDYLDVIVDRDCVEPVLDSLARYLAAHGDSFDAVDLCNIPEHSPTYRKLPEFLERYGFSVEVKQQEVCPVIQLPDDWETYLALLDKKHRHELRRKVRRAEGAPEGIGWYIVDESHDLEAEITRFLGLMADSTPDKTRFLEDDANLAFFKEIIRVAHDQGWLVLSFLTVGGEACATYLEFAYGDRMMVYNSGLRPEGYAYLSPGIVLLAYNIRHAIDAGYKIFDFLRGNESYKYHLGGRDEPVFMVKAKRSTR